MKKQRLISIGIHLTPYQDFINNLVTLSSQGSSYTCFANVHMLVECHKDPGFAKIVNNADMVAPDGMPLTWGLQLIHGVKQDRVTGMDALPHLLATAEEKDIPVYFYGGTDDMLRKTKSYIRQYHPQLQLAGMYSPPFRKLTAEEDQEVVDAINASGAKFVFVALGCPKQEKWMASMKGRINACMIGIGGALPVMIGMQSRAPEWMQKVSMEWLYRFMQEPKRLFKRYLVTNSTFMWLMLKAWIQKGRGRMLYPAQEAV